MSGFGAVGISTQVFKTILKKKAGVYSAIKKKRKEKAIEN